MPHCHASRKSFRVNHSMDNNETIPSSTKLTGKAPMPPLRRAPTRSVSGRRPILRSRCGEPCMNRWLPALKSPPSHATGCQRFGGSLNARSRETTIATTATPRERVSHPEPAVLELRRFIVILCIGSPSSSTPPNRRPHGPQGSTHNDGVSGAAVLVQPQAEA